MDLVFIAPDSLIGRVIAGNPSLATCFQKHTTVDDSAPFFLVPRELYERIGALLLENERGTPEEVWAKRTDLEWVSAESDEGKQMVADPRRANDRVYAAPGTKDSYWLIAQRA